MMSNVGILTGILILVVVIFVILLIILVAVYVNMKLKEREAEKVRKGEKIKTGQKEEKEDKVKQFTVESVFDFMEFDKVEDNMIVQRDGKRYLMVVECQGINYDLMSNDEKIGVEEGFIQFLNTLTSPVQIYVQTRKINLDASLNNYNKSIGLIENAYKKQKIKYEQLAKDINTPKEVLNREYYELIKQQNLYEYGRDIVYNTERMSLNKNILNKKYYVIVSYFASEVGEDALDKEEIKDAAFSELYTKAQAIIRALSISGVIGKIMSSNDIVELLYMAYNRDDAEVYGIDKALNARYDELYSTAPDYMDKKMKLLDERIDREAFDLANSKVIEVQTEKQKKYKTKEEEMDDLITNLAKMLIEENAQTLGRDVADEAKAKIDNEKHERRKEVDGEKEQKAKRTKNATK